MTTDLVAVGPGAIGVMRRVGPTSWTVLTALMLDAEPAGDVLLVRASSRSLGAVLGLNKDTVARALLRLRHADFAVPVASRFEPGAYRLTVPVDVITLVSDASLSVAQPRSRQPLVRGGTQLALLAGD